MTTPVTAMNTGKDQKLLIERYAEVSKRSWTKITIPSLLGAREVTLLRAQVLSDGHSRKAIAVHGLPSGELVIGILRSKLGGEGMGEVMYSFSEIRSVTIYSSYAESGFTKMDDIAEDFIRGFSNGYGD